MATNHPSPFNNGAFYGQQQHQQQPQMHPMASMTATSYSTPHFQAALHQRFRQPHHYPSADYDGRYISPYSYHPYSYASARHYHGSSGHLGSPYLGQTLPHSFESNLSDRFYYGHENNNGNEILLNRARYFQNYHHQQQQHYQSQPSSYMHGVLGHQPVPSSVLHYPPSASSYQHFYQQQQQQRQQQAKHFNPLTLTNEQFSTQNFGSQSQEPRSAQIQTPFPHSESMYNQITNSSICQEHQSDFQPDQAFRYSQPSPHPTKTPDIISDAVVCAGSSSSNSSPAALQQPARECLTSPPLISATGTDSGISSCSQSTPVYSGEYPMSVESTSGQCFESKEIEEFRAQERENNSSKEEVNTITGTSEHEQRLEEINEFENDKEAKIETKSKAKQDISKTDSDTELKQIDPTFDDKLNDLKDSRQNFEEYAQNSEKDSHLTDQLCTEPKAISSKCFAADTEMPTFNTDETHATQSYHLQNTPQRINKQLLQQQQEQFSEKIESGASVTNAASSRHPCSPLSSTSDNWQQQHLKIAQKRSHSPSVPAPPQNSPVGYNPYSSSTHSDMSISYPTTTSKNRIIECDLIPSKKKSKRKIKKDPNEEDQERIQNLKPLPDFQQAFGATEIGRFSETFLLNPQSSNESLDIWDQQYSDYWGSANETSYNSSQNFGAVQSQYSWPQYENRDSVGQPRNIGKSNIHYSTRPYRCAI